jgi:hypothetical protein
MRSKRRTFSTIVLVALIAWGAAIAHGAQPAPSATAATPAPDAAYPYQLFPTTNIWTQILLDTSTGRAWQVQFSVTSDAPSTKVVINGTSLLPPGVTPKSGRFTLSPTQNMYTFLLLDRQDSRVWQLQWSIEPENRGIVRSIEQEK